MFVGAKIDCAVKDPVADDLAAICGVKALLAVGTKRKLVGGVCTVKGW